MKNMMSFNGSISWNNAKWYIYNMLSIKEKHCDRLLSSCEVSLVRLSSSVSSPSSIGHGWPRNRHSMSGVNPPVDQPVSCSIEFDLARKATRNEGRTGYDVV